MDNKLGDYLKNQGIKYKEYRHPAVYTVEESKRLKQDIPGLHCKTLFLKARVSGKDKFYLVGMPADKKLDNKKFRKHLGFKKIRFGTPEELKKKVNLVPGSVSIFGAIYIEDDTKLVIDREVWEAKMSGFHPNINTSTLVLDRENLKKFYGSLNCEKEILEL
jgi:Ala-tRNA(Pro) deacylase